MKREREGQKDLKLKWEGIDGVWRGGGDQTGFLVSLRIYTSVRSMYVVLFVVGDKWGTCVGTGGERRTLMMS